MRRFFCVFFMVLGEILIVAVLATHAYNYNKHWTLGKYYLPTMLIKNGVYSDGCEADAITHMLERSRLHNWCMVFGMYFTLLGFLLFIGNRGEDGYSMLDLGWRLQIIFLVWLYIHSYNFITRRIIRIPLHNGEPWGMGIVRWVERRIP